MKLEHKGVGYESNFKPKSTQFKIGDPRVLITLVRDKLYSDKLRVFLQEYISNARDANREAGTPDHQIDITVPTKSEPLFKVRDYGPGLSEERVENVFVQFGVSTKRSSDAMIGGFGIGAKSAWAYTDSFVVISYHEGTERHYLCHLGKNPEGEMSLMHEGKTDKPNGVEIQVQVKEHDVQRAQHLIEHLLGLWPKKPNVINHKYNFPTAIRKKELGLSLYDGFGGDGMVVSLDGVPYSIEDKYLNERLSVARYQSWGNRTIVFEAKTGDIDVAANRENVEINDKYYEWIDAKRKEIIDGIFYLHFHAAQKGFVEYVKFYNEVGKHLRLNRTRLNQKQAEDVRHQKIVDYANSKLFGFYDKLVASDMVLPEAVAGFMQPRIGCTLDPEIPRDVRMSEWFASRKNEEDDEDKKTHGSASHFIWYFKEENILVIDVYFYPLDMLETKFLIRYAETKWVNNRQRKGKEIFQKRLSVWSPMLNPLSFDMLDSMSSYNKVPKLLYNDQKYTVEQFKKINSRIPGSHVRMLDVPEIPQYLKDLDVRGVSTVLAPVYRAERQRRVKRESGTLRMIDVHEERGFSFNSYDDASSVSRYDDKDEDEVAEKELKEFIYILTSEKTSEWKPGLAEVKGRLAINDHKIVQVSKTALEYLKAEGHTLHHWKDWVEAHKVPEKGMLTLTQKELELFGACWIYDKHHTGYGILTHYAFDNFEIKHKGYLALREMLKELREQVRSSVVRDFVYSKRKRITSLEGSKIFKARLKLVEKYPLLPLIEQVFDRRSNKSDILNAYLMKPDTFTTKMLKEHTDVSGWVSANEDCEEEN